MVNTRSGRKMVKPYPLPGVCKGRPINNCTRSKSCKKTKANIRRSYCRKKTNRH